MDAWELQRYSRPYLSVDRVAAGEGSKDAVVVADGESFDLEVPGVDGPELVRRLEELRDPSSGAWGALRTGESEGPWGELLDQLDTLGLVANDDDGGATVAETERRELVQTVDELSGWLVDGSRPWDRDQLAPAIDALDAVDGRRTRGELPWVEVHGVANFPLTALALQQRYWTAAAPLLATLVDRLLTDVRGEDRGPGSDAADRNCGRTGSYGATSAAISSDLDELAGGPEDPKDAVSALHGAAALLALSTRPDAAPLCTRPSTAALPSGRGRVSGLNLALEAEGAARRALEEIGTARYLTELEAGTHPDSFVPAAFVEEFHITRRFVETITPALARRLRPRLRQLVFRYYGEEVGHEAFEQATCESLGVTAAQLHDHHPAPFHLAHVDAYVALAQSDAVAYLASVMVTEGLPGDPFGINDLLDPERYGERFATAFREHEGANTQMAHNTLSRLLLAEVPSVSPRQRARALDYVVFLTELTHRAWALLFDLHSDGPWAAALPPTDMRQRPRPA